MIDNILGLKLNFTDGKGNLIVDLWQQSIQWLTDNITVDTSVLVTDDFKMRPDLIAQAAWGKPADVDLLLKYNGISNPFSINTGDLIIVPDLTQMMDQLFQPDPSISQAISTAIDSTQTIQFQTIIQTTQAQATAKQQYNNRNAANSNLPISSNSPNQAETGDQEMAYSNGNIYFGPSVGNQTIPS